MAKYDVYRLRGDTLVVDCQADLLSDLQTRFVVPLIPAEKAELTARDHKNAGDEVWLRTVYGILLGLRSAETQGYSLRF